MTDAGTVGRGDTGKSMYVTIINSKGSMVATANVEDKGEYYIGEVNIDKMPKNLRLKLEEYENLLNDLVLSLLDEIEEQIQLDLFQVFLRDGTKLDVQVAYILPKSKSISLKKCSHFV